MKEIMIILLAITKRVNNNEFHISIRLSFNSEEIMIEGRHFKTNYTFGFCFSELEIMKSNYDEPFIEFMKYEVDKHMNQFYKEFPELN